MNVVTPLPRSPDSRRQSVASAWAHLAPIMRAVLHAQSWLGKARRDYPRSSRLAARSCREFGHCGQAVIAAEAREQARKVSLKSQRIDEASLLDSPLMRTLAIHPRLLISKLSGASRGDGGAKISSTCTKRRTRGPAPLGHHTDATVPRLLSLSWPSQCGTPMFGPCAAFLDVVDGYQ